MQAKLNNYIESIFSATLDNPWFFTDFSFLVTFSFFIILYSFLSRKGSLRIVYTILFSLFFYYKSSGWFLLLFILLILSDYCFALWMDRTEKYRKLILFGSILFSLSFLLYFKYSALFITTCNQLFLTNFKSTNLFLPIGISFYTFQSISYVMDVYKRNIPATKNFIDYTFYMTFFPHLVAGPIVRAKDFLPQINTPLEIDYALYKESLFRILSGLIKKLLIADYLAKYVELVHHDPNMYSGFENLVSMYTFTFQIYFDFSGYSDIAIGIAILLGYRLKENFDSPYISSNISLFWRRWHISLSSWLRDYIYIPLGGNKRGVYYTYLFLLLTMLIGGFWHGANWKFVLWGFAHGCALIIHKLWTNKFPNSFNSILGRFFAWFLTFHFVALLWIFFVAVNFQTACDSILNIFTQLNFNEALAFYLARTSLVYVFFASFILVVLPIKFKTTVKKIVMKTPLLLWPLIILLMLQLIIQFKDDTVQPFIYFQF